MAFDPRRYLEENKAVLSEPTVKNDVVLPSPQDASAQSPTMPTEREPVADRPQKPSGFDPKQYLEENKKAADSKPTGRWDGDVMVVEPAKKSAFVMEPSMSDDFYNGVMRGFEDSLTGHIVDFSIGKIIESDSTAVLKKSVIDSMTPEEKNVVFSNSYKKKSKYPDPVTFPGKAAGVLTSIISDVPAFLLGGAAAKGVGSAAKTIQTYVRGEKAAEAVAAKIFTGNAMSRIGQKIGYLFTKEGAMAAGKSAAIASTEAAAIVGGMEAGKSVLSQSTLKSQYNKPVDYSEVALMGGMGAAGGALMTPPVMGASSILLGEVVKPTLRSLGEKLFPQKSALDIKVAKLRSELSKPIYQPEYIAEGASDKTRMSIVRTVRGYDRRVAAIERQTAALTEELDGLVESNLSDYIDIVGRKYKDADMTQSSINKLAKQMMAQKEKSIKTKLARLEEQAKSIKSTPEYKKIQEAKGYAVYSPSIDPSNIITNRAMILDPSIVRQASDIPDLNAELVFDNNAIHNLAVAAKGVGRGLSQFFTKDTLRLTQQMDGNTPYGFVVRNFFKRGADAIDAANVKIQEDLSMLSDVFSKLPFKRPTGLVSKGISKVEGFVGKENYADFGRKFTDYAQGRMSAAESEAFRTPEIDAAVKAGRGIYDEIIDGINKNRVKMNISRKNPVTGKEELDLIPKRADYWTHLHEMNFYESIGIGVLRPDSPINLKKTKMKQRFEKKRTGGDFIPDPVGAIETYIRTMRRTQFLEEPTNVMDAISSHMKPGNRKILERFTAELRGQPHWLDEGVSKIPYFGSAYLWFADKASSITSGGALGSSLSLLAQQPTTAVSSLSRVDARSGISAAGTMAKKAIASPLSAMKTMISHPEMSDDFVYKNSPIFRNRADAARITAMTKVDQVMNGTEFINNLIKNTDLAMYKHSYLSAYRDGVDHLGMSHAQAAIYGDLIAAPTQVMYGKGFRPEVFNIRTIKPFTQFMTFPVNLFNQFVSDPAIVASYGGSKGAASAFFKLYGGMVVANRVAVATGSQKPFDLPFLDIDDSGGYNLTPNPGALSPVTGTARYGFGIVPKMMWAGFQIVHNYDSDSMQTKNALEDLKKLSPAIVPQGMQINKIVQGYIAHKNGSYEYYGDDIDIDGATESARAILFGPWNTKAAKKTRQEYMESRKD